MTTNILKAIKNIIKNPTLKLTPHTRSKIGINCIGDTLEYYLKDAFCDVLNIDDPIEKNNCYAKYLSYQGDQNHPPDFMIRGGDACESKKLSNVYGDIALNSSYPKNKLCFDDPMITKNCKNCEDWDQKDLIYIIGNTKKKVLKSLWFVYGDCYSDNKNIYRRLKNKVSESITNLPNIEFSPTKELAKINCVDSLGITYFRARGMWHISHPNKVFNYITKLDQSLKFSIKVIMLKDKYLSFSECDRIDVEKYISVENVKIKSPINSAKLLDAKFLSFKI